MEKFVALLFSGIAEGAIVSLAAVGLLLLHKATGLINFAHGDFITLGAYLAIWQIDDLGMPIVVGYVIALAFMFLVGVAMERVAVAPLKGKSVHVVVIATLGLALALRSIVGIWQGTRPKDLESPVSGTTDVGGRRHQPPALPDHRGRSHRGGDPHLLLPEDAVRPAGPGAGRRPRHGSPGRYPHRPAVDDGVRPLRHARRARRHPHRSAEHHRADAGLRRDAQLVRRHDHRRVRQPCRAW